VDVHVDVDVDVHVDVYVDEPYSANSSRNATTLRFMDSLSVKPSTV
jgi:hypothetical protein